MEADSSFKEAFVMKKFIILSSQRTGSGYLQECMNSHPDIACYGEILIGYGGEYKKMPPLLLKRYRRLRTLWQVLFSGALLMPGRTVRDVFCSDEAIASKAVGFRVMYNQLERNPLAMRAVLEQESVHVIHLQRRNLLKKYASHVLMHNHVRHGRKAAHLYEKVSAVQVRIDLDAAIKYFRKEERVQQKYTEMFSNYPVLPLFYEDIVGAGGIVFSERTRILQFLELSDGEMRSKQVKANPSQLEDYISNYEELRARLQDTKWVDFLA